MNGPGSQVFISYSRTDRDQAETLRLELTRHEINTWMDTESIPKGAEWDREIDEAIERTSVMLVLVTGASNDSLQVKGEWSRALTLNIPIIPLLFDTVTVPRTLAQFNWIDFTKGFGIGLSNLLLSLRERAAKRMDDLLRIKAALHERGVGEDEELVRKALTDNLRESSDLARRISEQGDRVRRGLEERQNRRTENRISGSSPRGPRVAGPRLQDVTDYFKNRTLEMAELGRALESPLSRLIKIVGRAGIGKTALISRVLADLEVNRWPHRPQGPKVDSIIYLAADGASGLSLDQVFLKAAIALNEPSLVDVWTDPRLTVDEKGERLLHAFDNGIHILLIDGIDSIVGARSGTSNDPLLGFLRQTVQLSHCLRVVTTSLADIYLGPRILRHTRLITLNEGLSDEDGVSVLRELDPDGRSQFANVPDKDLAKVVAMVHGVPRALELFAGLAAYRPLDSVQQLIEGFFRSDDVITILLQENYQNLDDGSRLILLALAVYGRPVPVIAVDYLLQELMPGLDVPDKINELGRTKAVQIEATSNLVTLHPIDRDWLLRLQKSRPQWIPALEFPLLHRRAADYYLHQRRPKAGWADIQDLFEVLYEIEHRIQAGQFAEAHDLLNSIDSEYLERWGHYSRAVDLRETLRAHLTGRAAVVNLRRLGRLYAMLGDLGTALACFNSALPLIRELGDSESEIAVQLRIAASLRDLGRLREAIAAYRHALEAARGPPRHLLQEIEAIYGLGWSYRASGRIDDAVTYFNDALDALNSSEAKTDTIEWQNLRINTLHNLGLCMRATGRLKEAICYYDRAAELADKTQNRGTQAYLLASRATIHRLRGAFTVALTHYQEALNIYVEIGDKWGEASTLRNIGLMHVLSGDPGTAQLYFDRSEPMAEKSDNKICLGIILMHRAENELSMGNVDGVLAYAERAFGVFRSIDAARYPSHARALIATAQLAAGNLTEARDMASNAAATPFVPTRQLALLILGIICLREQKDQDAARNLAAASEQSQQQIATAGKNYELSYVAALAAAGLCILGRTTRSEALQAFTEALSISQAPGVLGCHRAWLPLLGPRVNALGDLNDFIGPQPGP